MSAGCRCIIVDVTSKFNLSLQLVMKGSSRASLMNVPLWEALYVSSTPDDRDPNQAPTKLAPSIPEGDQGEAPSIPATPRYDPEQGDVSPQDADRGEAIRIVVKERMTQTTTTSFSADSGIS